eukprot:TRINITY_DN4736_c0_g1_i1.p1 TRINITY_DN4736_c0_g1~~TRINITY_DN4736_c0_g1_i1.p1  ORF type:complete len:464 (-),score=30.65 TRINITY_DN4736_c0_g1_i1:94-1485(-)
MSWLSIPLSLIVLPICTYIGITMSPTEGTEFALGLTGLACLIEICSEPIYILTTNLDLFRGRTMIEFLSQLGRCYFTFIFVYSGIDGILAFAYGHLLYSSIRFLLFALYIYLVINYFDKTDLVEKHMENIYDIFPSFDVSLSTLTGITTTNYITCIIKFILQESEKIVLSYAETLANQGVFSVVNNLGSLVVRFIFNPIEEGFGNIFAKLLSDVERSDDVNVDSASLRIIEGNHILTVLLKSSIYFGLFFISFGPGYSFFLINLLYGDKYSSSEAPRILSYYCLYVMLLALNGTSERVVNSIVSKENLDKRNNMMGIHLILHLGGCLLLQSFFGNVGIVLSGCFSTTIRIYINWYYIRLFFKKYGKIIEKSSHSFATKRVICVGTILPPFPILGTFLVSGIALYSLGNHLCCQNHVESTSCIVHVIIGGITGIIVLIVIYFREADISSIMGIFYKRNIHYKEE